MIPTSCKPKLGSVPGIRTWGLRPPCHGGVPPNRRAASSTSMASVAALPKHTVPQALLCLGAGLGRWMEGTPHQELTTRPTDRPSPRVCWLSGSGRAVLCPVTAV